MEQDFLTMLGHEVRTPITSLKGALDLLCAEALGAVPGRLLPLLDIAQRNSNRLARLVEDLMLIGEMRVSDIARELRPVDPEPLLLAAIADRQSANGTRGTSFELSGGSGGACVQAASIWLTRGLARMLDLAAQPPGKTAGPAIVSLHREAGSIRIICPMPMEGPRHDDILLAANVRKGDAAATTDLGIGIVTAVIAAHGGHVGSDTAPNGTPPLTISLPDCQPPRTTTTAAATPTASTTTTDTTRGGVAGAQD